MNDPEGLEERIEQQLDQLRSDAPAERRLLTQAIGGWRGVIDSALPAAAFITVYSLNGQQLMPAVWSAVALAGVITVLRLFRREPLTQVAGGFIGIAVSAVVASRTGQAQDFFLPGLLVNTGYFLANLISVLVGWPLLGLLMGVWTGSLTKWREVPAQRRACAAATWIWVGVFGLRLIVQVPLYLAEATTALGIAKITMGWPLFLLAAWLSFLVLRPVFARDHQNATAEEGDPGNEERPIADQPGAEQRAEGQTGGAGRTESSDPSASS